MLPLLKESLFKVNIEQPMITAMILAENILEIKEAIALKENNLYIKDSIVAGKGVFSNTRFNKGDIIEHCPLILFTKEDVEFLQHTNLFHYYLLPRNANSSRFLSLGFGAIYNHNSPSNAEFTIDERKKILLIKAACAIEANEEITINYNGPYNNNAPVVFARKDDVYEFSINLF